MLMTEALLQRMESLAYLQISEEKRQIMIEDLNKMLKEIEALHAVNTEGVEPLVHIHGLSNITRADVVENDFSREQLLENAAVHTEEGFVVPKILG